MRTAVTLGKMKCYGGHVVGVIYAHAWLTSKNMEFWIR